MRFLHGFGGDAGATIPERGTGRFSRRNRENYRPEQGANRERWRHSQCCPNPPLGRGEAPMSGPHGSFAPLLAPLAPTLRNHLERGDEGGENAGERFQRAQDRQGADREGRVTAKPSRETIARRSFSEAMVFRVSHVRVARNHRGCAHAARQARAERRPHQVPALPPRPDRRGHEAIARVGPHPTRPEFAKEAARQARLLRGRPEEGEALAFIEAAFSWPDK
jgi:hypothetical protein